MPKILEFNAVEEGGGYDVELFFAIDDNLTEGFIKGGARLDIFDTMKALYSSNYNIRRVDMHGTYSMSDDFGNVKELEVMHARLVGDTASRINWANMTTDMFFNILDFKFIHPAFQ